MTEPDRTIDEWGALLKENWEKRASSDSRDFFVASHPGWQDAERWDAQARHDVDHILTGLDSSQFAQWNALEIGCGVGRLGKPLADRMASYTGFDIAPSMIEEARSRNAERTNMRFFLSDGISIPAEAKDRSYDFIMSLGVLIHLPRAVISALISEAYELLAPGAQLRYQVLADPNDPTGVPEPQQTAEAAAAAEAVVERAEEMEAGATDRHRELIDNHYFMGDAFRYDELRPFLEAAAPGSSVETVRLDLVHIYGWVQRPPA